MIPQVPNDASSEKSILTSRTVAESPPTAAAVLAVVDAGDGRAADVVQPLEELVRSAGLQWFAASPSDVAEVIEQMGDDGDAGHPRGVVGVGGAGEAALMAAADDARVGALVLVGAPLSGEALAIAEEWPELPIMSVATPTDRDGLRGAVDVHLASSHPSSELVVGPVDEAAMGAVAEWMVERLTRAARVEEVVLETADGWEVHGTRWLPDRDDLVPGVVLLHTGRSDRSAFARLERLLAEAGLAVLNIDWRGRGQTINRGSYFDLDDAEKAAAWRDALAAVEHLAGRPEVDADRMGAVGVVHGAEYAVRAAVRDQRLKALVLLTGYRPADPSESERLTREDIDVLYVTSTDHRITTDAMRELYEASPSRRTRYVEYPGGAIGYQLFEIDPDLEPAVVDWLGEALGP